MKFKITHRIFGNILFSIEADSWRLAVTIWWQNRYLPYAAGVNKNLTTPLRILLEQPGAIRAYKLVSECGEGPYATDNGYAPINYFESEEFSVETFNLNESISCGAGISLASLDWCIKHWRPGYRILIMEFFANAPKHNLCVPTATDGKFRVKACRRVGETDLRELGLKETA
jgi:hypothetical protein